MLAGEVGSFIKYDVPEHIQYYIYGSYGTNWKHLHRNNSLIARGKKKAFASLFLQTNKQTERGKPLNFCCSDNSSYVLSSIVFLNAINLQTRLPFFFLTE